jgi:homoserine O-acetyltransferase
MGGSLGGMQALAWSIMYPERLRHCVVIASTPSCRRRTSPSTTWRARPSCPIPITMAAISTSMAWCRRTACAWRAWWATSPICRTTTWPRNSAASCAARSGDYKFDFGVDFEIESYLRYQGDKFSEYFDANTYLLITKALDYFDPARAHGGDLAKTLAGTKAKFFLASFTTDWRFSPERSREIVQALVSNRRQVTYAEIDAPHGHDAFLLEDPRYMNMVRAYYGQVWNEIGGAHEL